MTNFTQIDISHICILHLVQRDIGKTQDDGFVTSVNSGIFNSDREPIKPPATTRGA